MHSKGLRILEAAIGRLLERKPKNRLLRKKLGETGRIEITQTNVALEANRDRSNMVKNYPEMRRRIRETNAGLRGKTTISLTERYHEANVKIRALSKQLSEFETYIASLELKLSNTNERLLHEQRRNRRSDTSNLEEFPKK